LAGNAPGIDGVVADYPAKAPELSYPDWLEFHSWRVGGPVASVRSRSGIARLEAGEGETADRVVFGIPDDEAWLAFRDTLETAGFWQWTADAAHREPHREGDWYWWLDVRYGSQGHRAGAWSHAPDGFDEVRAALFELVEQVLADEPLEDR
jgi:hypothetical protein